MYKKTLKKIIKASILAILILLGSIYALHLHIILSTEASIHKNTATLNPAFTAIVLGASVRSNGTLSTVLKDRVNSAIELYQSGIVKRILVSGDNSTKHYNEPIAMKDYLIAKGIPAEHIFMDFAGFDTFDTMYRAKAIFEIENAIIVTQEFHLPRALFIAKKLNLNCAGYIADQHQYPTIMYNKAREALANVKAYLNIHFSAKPKFLGEKIPITGPPQHSF